MASYLRAEAILSLCTEALPRGVCRTWWAHRCFTGYMSARAVWGRQKSDGATHRSWQASQPPSLKGPCLQQTHWSSTIENYAHNPIYSNSRTLECYIWPVCCLCIVAHRSLKELCSKFLDEKGLCCCLNTQIFNSIINEWCVWFSELFSSFWLPRDLEQL